MARGVVGAVARHGLGGGPIYAGGSGGQLYLIGLILCFYG